MNTIKNNLKSTSKPIYKIEVKAYLCSFEIEVNDIPCFSYFDEPQIATDVPINNLIFSSGEQNVTFKIFPLNNNKTFHKDTKIELNVFVKEANGFYLKKEIVNTYLLTEPVENKTFFEDQFFFKVEIPYEIDTSKINHNFINEEKDKLFLDIYNEYKILANYIIEDDLVNYNKFTKMRFLDIVKSHYLDENKTKYYLNKALFTYKDYNLSLVSKEEYILKFCFNNKLAFLQKHKNAPGIILEDKNSHEEGLHFIESAIFFRNDHGELKLFR